MLPAGITSHSGCASPRGDGCHMHSGNSQGKHVSRCTGAMLRAQVGQPCTRVNVPVLLV